MKKFWSMKKIKNSTSAELIMYGEISSTSWWGDEVTPKQFSDDLAALGNIDELKVRINSPGGDVFAGVAIHAMLKRHAAKVIVYVDGLAASIASIIAMAGDEIVMPKGSMMMIHNPWSWSAGEAKDFRKMADTLDTIRDSMLEIYTEKTGMSSDEIIPLLDAETWLTASSAVEKGFATQVEESFVAISASVRGNKAFINGVEMDLSRFKAPPIAAADPKLTPNPDSQEIDEDDNPEPAYSVGERVLVAGTPHVEGQSTGEVREALLTWVYGVVFDGMEDKGIYHWYAESELLDGDPELPGESPNNKLQTNAPENSQSVFLLRKKLELKTKTL
ncbi:Clp protease ClpP [Paenibacillus frigoriresistens]|uniref:head maturation protease, ClpP-related n=1 Tax=Paenibacillus alginolyticus TaxID=59839 RepID=UPI00156754B1|nr:head maturation protease, ClpP-related [Paenibacillus frigoriresistens]NRF91539.1 Clp protease ClpP [Paenibacillus frigoriresistens]